MAFPLASLDPAADLDDLAPLLDVVGDARVVAIGEANHDVREFGLLRHRVVRLLVERAGFDAVGWESGFAEARRVAAWLRGGAGDPAQVATGGLCYRFGEAAEVQDLLGWLRGRGVVFAGLDVPGSGGSAAAVWPEVEAFLAEVDPRAVGLVAAAREAVAPFSAANSGIAMRRYADVDAAGREAADRAVADLLAHVEGLGSGERVAEVVHVVRTVRFWLRFLREVTTPGATSIAARDECMAASVRWLLRRHRRVVVAVHNGHAQRVPVRFEGLAPLRPMGAILGEQLGAGYRAIGVTCGGGRTPGMEVDERAPAGMRIFSTPLPPPREDGVEAWAHGRGMVGFDLRGRDGAEGPQWIRHADQHVRTPVFAAFDGLLHVPEAVPSGFVAAQG